MSWKTLYLKDIFSPVEPTKELVQPIQKVFEDKFINSSSDFSKFNIGAYQQNDPNQNYYMMKIESNEYLAQITKCSLNIKNGESIDTNSTIVGFQGCYDCIGENALFVYKQINNIFCIKTIYVKNLLQFEMYVKYLEEFIYRKIKQEDIHLLNLINYCIYIYTPIYTSLSDYTLLNKKAKTSPFFELETKMKEYKKKLVFM